jgi:hypothetical protein
MLEERAKRTSDNEYFNHCQMLEANLRTGLYQYGTAHLAALVNWVPRRFWLDKPQRGLGFLPEALQTLDRDDSSNLGVGGAWGAVADSFNNYWYFFPVFWLGVGWLTAAAFLKAQVFGSLPWKLHNVGILCAAHWFIAQSFAEAFVPFMIYQGVFFIAFQYARVRVTRKLKPSDPAPRPGPAPEPSGSGAGVSPATGTSRPRALLPPGRAPPPTTPPANPKGWQRVAGGRSGQRGERPPENRVGWSSTRRGARNSKT